VGGDPAARDRARDGVLVVDRDGGGLGALGFRSWYFLARHAMFVGVGILAAFVAFQVPMKAWQRLAPWIFLAGVCCSPSSSSPASAGP
jgi:cell division protein FtsW (lipid II flippase)